MKTVASFVALSAFAGSALSQTVTAQNYSLSTFSPSSFRTDVGYQAADFPNTTPAQPFPASVSGRLSFMTAYMRRWDWAAGQPLEVGIHTYAPGWASPGTFLGSATIPFSSVVANDQFQTFDLTSAGVNLKAGNWYVFVFRASPASGNWPYSFRQLQGNPEAFGARYLHSRDGTSWQPTGIDLEIPLRVEVVPGPTGASMAAVAGLLTARRRRK